MTIRNSGWVVRSRETHGSEIAELAMILPLLFMILLAIFWFGQAFRIYGTLTHASRQAARAAVAPVCTTCAAGVTSAQNAKNVFWNALAANHLDSAQLIPTSGWTAPTQCLCQNSPCSPVACDGSVVSICVQPNVQLSYSTVQGAMGSCGTSVSARYQNPYHFVIPFTRLDIFNIQFPGQAQMRAETQ